MRSFVQKATNERLAEWLEENPTEANKVVKKGIAASLARLAAKNARNAIRRKTALSGAGMPDKLKDCASKNADESELFIVEGDSAGGTALDARNPFNQAILPIRGKILNVERARVEKMLKNNEIQALITATVPVRAEYDVTKARYHKVIALCAPMSTAATSARCAQFFFRQMRDMVESVSYIAHRRCTPRFVGKENGVPEGRRRQSPLPRRTTEPQEGFQRLKGSGSARWTGGAQGHDDGSLDAQLLQATSKKAEAITS